MTFTLKCSKHFGTIVNIAKMISIASSSSQNSKKMITRDYHNVQMVIIIPLRIISVVLQLHKRRAY